MIWALPVPASSNKAKIILIATFASCLIFFVIHGSWQDRLELGLLVNDEGIHSSEDASLSPPALNILRPTRAAIVAAARATEDLTWMKELAEAYVP